MPTSAQIRASVWRYRLLLITGFAVFVLDQVTKLVIMHSGLPLGVYPPMGGIEVIPGFFSIVYSTNIGAAWGLFAGYGIWLALLGIAAISAIVLMRKALELQKPFMQLTFGLMTGGILGNIVDRAMHGHVIDFLDFHLGFYRWPTFNVADTGIVLGVIFYAFYTFRCERQTRKGTRVQLY